MKRLFILTIFFLIRLTKIGAQVPTPTNTDPVFITPHQTPPKYKYGTNKELMEILYSKIQYPIQECIEGTTILQFTIDTLGQVQDPIIRKSISKKIDAQLLEEICNFEFEPGTLRRKKVKTNMNLPFRIKLE